MTVGNRRPFRSSRGSERNRDVATVVGALWPLGGLGDWRIDIGWKRIFHEVILYEFDLLILRSKFDGDETDASFCKRP